jgi:hypothetical protein
VPNGPRIASVLPREPIFEETGVLVNGSPQADDSEKLSHRVAVSEAEAGGVGTSVMTIAVTTARTGAQDLDVRVLMVLTLGASGMGIESRRPWTPGWRSRHASGQLQI